MQAGVGSSPKIGTSYTQKGKFNCNLLVTELTGRAEMSICIQWKEVGCSRPVGQACDVCWKVKKSCNNGGMSFMII